MRNSETCWAVCVCGVLCGVVACGGEGAAPGEPTEGVSELGTVEAEILNGTLLTPAQSGHPFVQPPGLGGCSGRLLKNKWVLTAAHCADIRLDHTWSGESDAGFPGFFSSGSAGTTITSAKVDTSGRLVIAGKFTPSTGGDRFYLARFTSAGGPDSGFGTSGVVTTDFPFSTAEGINGIDFQTDGKIVAAGYVTLSGHTAVGAARYNTDGTPDGFFGLGGQSQWDFTDSADESAVGVAIDGSGRAVMAVGAQVAGVYKAAVARLNTGGYGDNTFAAGVGYVYGGAAAGNYPMPKAIAIDTSGNILLAAMAVQPNAAWATIVERFTSSGAADNAFSGDGIAIIPSAASGNTTPYAILAQGTKVVVGGDEWTGSSTAAVWRLSATGTLDTGFGVSGWAKPTFFGQKDAKVRAMTVAADGRILLGIDGVAEGALSHVDESVPAYAALSSNGAVTADRIFPDRQATRVPTRNSTNVRAIATDGSRVFVVGNKYPNTASSFLAGVVLRPDTLTDTTITTMSVHDSTGNKAVDAVYWPTSLDDIALLHLAQPLSMNNSTTGYQFPGFLGSFGSIVGTTLTCYGWGNSAIDGAGNQSGAGQLRFGVSIVDHLDTSYGYLVLHTTGSPAQLPLTGDSGGVCQTSGGLVVSVASRGSNTESLQIRADHFSTWATQKIANP